MGKIYWMLDKYEEAMKYAQNALDIREKLLDQNDLLIADSLHL